MHELAIAQSIADAVDAEMARRPGQRLNAVGIRIGRLTDVVAESLSFGFAAIAFGTALAGVQLEIEPVPVSGCCLTCGKSGELEPPMLVCPVCRSSDIVLTTGQELEIVYLDLETQPPPPVATN